MLSTFPSLLTYVLLAPVILRVTVGIYGLCATWNRWFHKPYRWVAGLYKITSLLLIIGLYTQISALVGIALLVVDFMLDKKAGQRTTPVSLYILMGVVLLSLLVTGPGFLAFDLPL